MEHDKEYVFSNAKKTTLKNIKMVNNFCDNVSCLYVLKRVKIQNHLLLSSALNGLIGQSHVSSDILMYKELKCLKRVT